MSSGKVDFESILEQVGDNGRFQKRLLYLILIPISLIMPFGTESVLFMLSEPDHWCTVPAVAHLSARDQHLLIRPPVPGSTLRDSCHYYNDIDYGVEMNRLSEFRKRNDSGAKFTIRNEENRTTKACSEWTFDNSSYDANAVTEFHLICDRREAKSTLLMGCGIGGMAGSLFFGYCAGRFGRKKMLLVSLFATYTTLVVPMLVRQVWVFMTLRVLTSFFAVGIYDLSIMLLTEIVKPDKRSKVICLSATFWTVGMCLLPLAAFVIRNWIGMMIMPVVLMAPFVSFIWLLPESPRWLVSKRRYTDAYHVLTDIARVNGKVVSLTLMEQLKAINSSRRQPFPQHSRLSQQQQDGSRKSTTSTSSASRRKRAEGETGLTEVFRHQQMRRYLAIMTIAWIASYATYGGLTLNFENMEGNEFMNWFLLSLVEFPSNLVAWFCMESVIGRRWTTSGALITGGLALCAPVLVSNDAANWVLLFSLIGKFLTNIAFNVLYQQAVELFPTPLRTQASSYASSTASFVTLGLPFVTALGKGHVWIPLLIIGTAAIAGGIVTSFLPETLDQNLPQTIEDSERLGVGRPFFSLACKAADDIPRRQSMEKPRRSVTQINFR